MILTSYSKLLYMVFAVLINKLHCKCLCHKKNSYTSHGHVKIKIKIAISTTLQDINVSTTLLKMLVKKLKGVVQLLLGQINIITNSLLIKSSKRIMNDKLLSRTLFNIIK